MKKKGRNGMKTGKRETAKNIEKHTEHIQNINKMHAEYPQDT